MKPDFSIIIPSFNEIAKIEITYNDLLKSLENRSENVEIFFLDNGSTDGTREWLSSLDHPNVKVIFNEDNVGKSGSVIKGISLSQGKYVGIQDSDFEYRASDVWKCYDRAVAENASLVIGGRFPNGYEKRYLLVNYLGVRFLSMVINVLYGCWLKDSASAVKVFNGDLARSIRFDSVGFEFDFELISRIARLGGKIKEIDAEYHPRTVEEGKKVRAFADGFAALKVILKNRFLPKSRIVR